MLLAIRILNTVLPRKITNFQYILTNGDLNYEYTCNCEENVILYSPFPLKRYKMIVLFLTPVDFEM